MNMFSKHKKILLVLVGLVILFIGYWYFVLSKKNQAATNMNTGGLTAGVIEPAGAVSSSTDSSLKVDKEFINGILALNSVNIDTSLFNTDAYKSLTFPDAPFPVDYAIPVGRGNPFLPIGAQGRSPFNIHPQIQGTPATPVGPLQVATTSPVVNLPASTTPATTTPPAKPGVRPTQVNR
ncbi:MAG: hypothetical protein RJB39_621 [Candidatus Parcubacteria bacterium]|jgi:hypothetical protein